MAGKRSWFVVRRALLEAAASCRAKQEALPHVLFVPESFRLEDEDIRARRRAALERVYRSLDEMMVVVGEIKEIVASHGAERIVLRHVGDMPFVMDQDMARQFHSGSRANSRCGRRSTAPRASRITWSSRARSRGGAKAPST